VGFSIFAKKLPRYARNFFDRLLDLGTECFKSLFQSESYQSAFNKFGSTLICTHTNKGRTIRL